MPPEQDRDIEKIFARIKASEDRVYQSIDNMQDEIFEARKDLDFFEWWGFIDPKKRPKPDPLAGGVPVIPNNPPSLSDGAAAELDFDD